MIYASGAALTPVVLLLLLSTWVQSNRTDERARPLEYVGNDACRTCHRRISESYSSTAMARTSGPAAPNLVEGSFDHEPSGVSYQVRRQGGAAFLSYDRPAPRPLHGTEPLKYSIGSNTRGRTFLFAIDRFLYQSPINYYAGKRAWDMSPGYAHVREMELNRPVDATCLFCHASRVQSPESGTSNRFAGDAFLQPGVGCERCHGPGSNHVKGRGPMINPATLAGERRDSICNQCHLKGEARIATRHRTEEGYAPGDVFSDYVAIFVREDAATDRLGAISQVEALARSTCKRRGGEALSCTTCHDPHMQPREGAKSAYYRARCLGCHAPMSQTHYPRQPDCAACHMPRIDSADIGHTMVTDHRIVRTGRHESQTTGGGRLIEFGRREPRARELGLAYGEVALRGDAAAAREAFQRLQEVLASTDADPDPDVLVRLAYLYQIRGDLETAETLYDRALKADPDRAVAAANLGVLYARRGLLARAIELWRPAFDNNPQLSELGVNLANGLCAAGDAAAARQVLQRVVKHNPDLGTARTLLSDDTLAHCTLR
jgi:predicted CXXCH cytochrome family protein